MNHCFSLMLMTLMGFNAYGQDLKPMAADTAKTAQSAKTDALKHMQKQSNNLLITGGIFMVVGIGLGAAGAASFAEGNDISSGSAAVTAGTLIFLGGTAMLTVGIVKSFKAGKMRKNMQAYLVPSVPPAQISAIHLPQKGVTLRINLAR